MVDFVLQELGSVSSELDLVGLSLQVLVADPDVIGPLNPYQQIREGEVLSHEEFWTEAEASRTSKQRGRKR